MIEEGNKKSPAGLTNQLLTPEIVTQILNLFKAQYINIPEKVILNILIAKLAQMVTSRRITFDESGRINIPNWYSLIFMQSGGGKDRIVKDFDKLIFAPFLDWFKGEAESIYLKQLEEQSKTEDKIINTQPEEKGEKHVSYNPF